MTHFALYPSTRDMGFALPTGKPVDHPDPTDMDHHQRVRILMTVNSEPQTSRSNAIFSQDMRNITIHMGRNGPRVSVRETETPGAWELEWTGNIEQRHARGMLKAAENAVLQNGGERIILTCSADQEILSAELDKRPPSIVSRSGDRCTMELITPGDDGFIHDDDDFRTPLERVTCPTCVERFARSRIRQRQDAFGKHEGPKGIAKHSRLIAEAYTRLAEIEENLEIPSPETVPGRTDAEWAEEDERIAWLGVVDEVSQWPE